MGDSSIDQRCDGKLHAPRVSSGLHDVLHRLDARHADRVPHKVRSFQEQRCEKDIRGVSASSCGTIGSRRPLTPGRSRYRSVRRGALVDIAWDDHANDEQGFRIERAADPTGPWLIRATVDASSLNTPVSSCRDGIGVSSRLVTASSHSTHTGSPHECRLHGSSANAIERLRRRPPTRKHRSQLGRRLERRRRVRVQRQVSGVWQVVANLSGEYNQLSLTLRSSVTRRISTAFERKRDGGFSDFSGSVMIAPANRPPDAHRSAWGESPQ